MIALDIPRDADGAAVRAALEDHEHARLAEAQGQQHLTDAERVRVTAEQAWLQELAFVELGLEPEAATAAE